MTDSLNASDVSIDDRRERFGAVYGLLEEAIASHAFPGCAFGVLAGDEVMVQDSLGHFTYEDSSPGVLSDSVFDVASLTKVAATTAAAMLLYQRGLLDLDMPLGELLPGFVIGRESGSFARHVQLKHLLAHNSGLPGYAELYKQSNTPSGVLRACLELPVATRPGTRVEYSDPGFILLGKAIEVIMRESLPEWVAREVFEPLGMVASRFNPASSERAHIPPTEMDHTLRHRLIQGEVQDENAWALAGAAGHAGLFSNVPDMLRYAQELIRAGKPTAGSGLQVLWEAATLQVFSQRQPPDASSRALGWDTPSANSSSGSMFSPDSIGHLGYSGCSLWIDAKAEVAVVLLTNRTWPDRSNQMIKEVRPLFHNAIRQAL